MNKVILEKLAAFTKPNELNNSLTGTGELSDNIVKILQGVIGILGAVAVVIIIIGGIGYMTSSGDAGKVKKAKDTILYGLIGLIICVLAFAIVHFVIANVLNGVD